MIQFIDSNDLCDFLFYADLRKQGETTNDLDKSYIDYEILRDVYTNNAKLQECYTNHDLGFRDFLQRNTVID